MVYFWTFSWLILLSLASFVRFGDNIMVCSLLEMKKRSDIKKTKTVVGVWRG